MTRRAPDSAPAHNGRCGAFTSPRRHPPWRLGHPEPKSRRRRRSSSGEAPRSASVRINRGRPARPNPRTLCSDADSKARCAPCPRRLRSSRTACCLACSDEFACAHPGDRVDFSFVGGARRSTNGGSFVMQSYRKNRLITICMLASALVMIGLALTGTLQMRVSQSPITALSQIDRP